jgi:hypothetical protein
MQCAHDACTCLVAEIGGFCSEACELGTMTAGFCGCDHAVCRSSRLNAPAIDQS